MKTLLEKLGEKLSNLGEILKLPEGLAWKQKVKNFHWKEYRTCLRLKNSGINPQTIFDVGGNEGQFSLAARITFPEAKIHVYEPGKEAFKRMKAGLEKNMERTAWEKTHLHHKALGEEEGKSILHVTNHDQSSSILCLHPNHETAFPEVKEERTEEVVVGTLEKEMGRTKPEGPILLKIDTQGFEMRVLKGAGKALEKIDWVLLETATQPMYKGEVLFPEILQWMQGKGFRFVGPVEVNYSPESGPVQFDALFQRMGVESEGGL